MSNPKTIFVPPEVGNAALEIIERFNPGRDIHVMLIAVETGAPPTMVSSIHPESIPDILQFLLDYHSNADVGVNQHPVEKKDLN